MFDFKRESTSIMVANTQDDDDLLHPKPRKSILSRKDYKIQKYTKQSKAPIWKPGPLIRLLSDAVHITTDPKNGVNIDPNTPPPPAIPQRLQIPPTSQMKLVGVMGDEGPDRFWYEGIASRGWHEGVPIFMRIQLVGPRRFAIVHANGEEVKEQAFVEWSTKLETPELREKAAEKLYNKVMQEIDAIDQLFKHAAKQYRIARRLWEIQVVRHEFIERQNYEIFRPGSTRAVVSRTIRMGRADIASES